jgi:hypothetical protein
MTPETAVYGIEKFNKVKDIEPKIIGYKNYPNLSLLPIFKK